MSAPEQDGATFSSLGVPAALVAATEAREYARPTEVQRETIPAALAGDDVCASAPTGSGKTAAYALPLLARLAELPSRRSARGRREVAALVVCPTRELAAQIGEEVESYARHLPEPPVTRTVFGGVSINPQMLALRGGADVVVATPGRLLDLVSKNALSLAHVSILVLDEADRLLDRGFEEELGRILEQVPAERQTLLLSATFPPRVRALAEAGLRAPHRVEVAAQGREKPRIVQRAIEVDRPRRTQLLRHLLNESPAGRVLVFVATTYATRHVTRKLCDLGFAAAALNGKLSQGARTAALAKLKSGEVRVLVATDVAARGLDIDGLSMVVNYDLPRSPNDYPHRIGRTGRAGEAGVAVSFLTAENREHFRLIEKRHRLRLGREHVPGFEPVEPEVSVTRTDGVGGVKGKRKSKKDKKREAAARAAKSRESS